MLTYRKEEDRNLLVVGRWSWPESKAEVPRSTAYGLYQLRMR
ncbi:MAG: hypothetical protein ACQEUT_10730 [Bacillota bacterium]